MWESFLINKESFLIVAYWVAVYWVVYNFVD